MWYVLKEMVNCSYLNIDIFVWSTYTMQGIIQVINAVLPHISIQEILLFDFIDRIDIIIPLVLIKIILLLYKGLYK